MNSTRKTRSQDDQSVASEAQSTPPQVQMGTVDHSFTLQAVIDLAKTVSELKVAIGSLKESVDKVTTKVEGLVAWKNVIFGGAIVLGAIFGAGWALFATFHEYVTISAPVKAAPPAASPGLPLQAPRVAPTTLK